MENEDMCLLKLSCRTRGSVKINPIFRRGRRLQYRREVREGR